MKLSVRLAAALLLCRVGLVEANETPLERALKQRSQNDLVGAAQGLMCPNGIDAEPARLYELGITLAWAGRLDEALDSFNELLRLEPHSRAGRAAKARTLHWLLRISESEEIFRTLLREDPADREARMGLAELSRSSVQFGVARSIYACMLRADPTDSEVLAARARLERDYHSELEVAAGASKLENADSPSVIGYARASLRLDASWTLFAGYRADVFGLPWTTGRASSFTHTGEASAKVQLSPSASITGGYRLNRTPNALPSGEVTTSHGPTAEGALRYKRLAFIAGVAPSIRSGGGLALLSSAGAQVLIHRGAYALLQGFRYDDTQGGYATSIVLSGETPSEDSLFYLRAGASYAALTRSSLATVWLEPHLNASSHIDAFARAEQSAGAFDRIAITLGAKVRL
jgi:hypothetical protein